MSPKGITGVNPTRNGKGGFKCELGGLPWPRKRHDGIRCYGEHVGSKCYPYDFSREPAIEQATFAPKRPSGRRREMAYPAR